MKERFKIFDFRLTSLVARVWALDSQHSVGFTLIEVLVALALMALAFGLIISTSTALGRKSRDQQRVSDLQNIQQGLAQYYADQNFYPETMGMQFAIYSAQPLTDATGNPNISTPTKTYFSIIPQDPRGRSFNSNYFYDARAGRLDATMCDNTIPLRTCQFYVICAILENPPSPATCSFGAYNYMAPSAN